MIASRRMRYCLLAPWYPILHKPHLVNLFQDPAQRLRLNALDAQQMRFTLRWKKPDTKCRLATGAAVFISATRIF